jgi:hypothetical protein
MSNEHKNVNTTETRKSERESQDALRHQQDEEHHKINRIKDRGDAKDKGSEKSR